MTFFDPYPIAIMQIGLVVSSDIDPPGSAALSFDTKDPLAIGASVGAFDMHNLVHQIAGRNNRGRNIKITGLYAGQIIGLRICAALDLARSDLETLRVSALHRHRAGGDKLHRDGRGETL